MARSRQPRRDLDDNSVRAWKRAASLRCNYYIASEFIESFFVGARSLIERDAESMQDVIRYMSEEHGLRYIQQLVERDFASLPLPSRTDIFKAQMMPFLEIISHPKVLSSLVAEHPLGTIYNFIYGIGGTRAESFISTLCFALQSLREDDETRADWLEGSLAVFSRMMFVNSSAFAQAGLQEQVIKLSNILLTMEKGGMARRLQVSRRYLDQILRRVESGAHIATPSTERQSHIITLTPPQDPPGGRHDNDHTDFCMVKIMPTLDEIVSPQAEYLPERDPRCWHVRGLEGLLDRNFRLLREDSVGVLRDSIYQLIKDSQAANSQPAKSGPRTNLYRGVKSIRSYLHWNDGFLFQLEFPQPRYLHRMKPLERKAWWSQSKRLQTGALVCLTIGCSQIVFCTVIQSPDQHHEESQKMASRNGEKSRDPPIRESATGDSITLAAVRPDERTVQSILDYFDQPNQSFLMVEFPGVLVPGFDPTLRALQSMKRNGHFPFENLLVPSAFDGQATIPPPLYASREGFQFNLRCLTNNDTDFFVRPNEPADVQKLCMSSTLDEAQATALVSSLQRSIGLIQGPPGTGKSFTGIALIRVLLAHKHGSGGNIGPVLCISYSNHALDQLLESLLGQDITSNIVRIGSQSKSEKLRACNIRIVAKLATKTREERHLQARLRSELQGCEAAYSKLPLRHVSEANLQQYLQQHHPHHSEQLFGEATNQGRFKSKDAKTIIRSWLTSGSVGVDQFNRSFEDLTLVNVHSMVRAERTRIYQHWLEHLAKLTRCEALKIVSTYSDAKRDWDLVRGELDLRCLADADVIGVTTSGLARNLDVLRKLQSKVIVCEEAGEILEAHLLTALLPSVEHAILIGDHLQLRPQVQNYNLSRENHNGGDRYSLDVSLFERLVSTKSSFGLGLPYTALETQRRMHPSIARLIRDTMYPGLKDADEVTEYPKVSGMKKRLFWLDHKFYEESTADDAVTTSHWNAHEVEMTVALVHHLVNQGKYKSCDLAVLTPYLGQLHRLRHKLSQSFAVCVGERDEQDLEKAGLEPEDNITPAVRSNLLDALRVATVDNFQGEEAKIIVISLVRSNPQNRCGFMGISNRINVLLSRAQHGMYILGNSETASHVQMWEHVIQILKNDDCLGQSIELECQRHPNTPISVSEPSHFLQLSPEGGCNLRCTQRLSCGHACENKCHSDMLHSAVFCRQACTRLRKRCMHPCPELCGSPCPIRCTVPVTRPGRKLECGHSIEVLPCYQDLEPSQFLCKEIVKRIVPQCKHEALETCHVNVDATNYRCTASCGEQLPCGHACKRKCHECTGAGKVDHGQCRQQCGRNYSTCRHLCRMPCHGKAPCPPCNAACEVRCNHSRCTRKCHEPCTPCAEDCLSACLHGACTMPCAAPCDHIPCSRRCEKKVRCGHQCPSVCGEQCPPKKFCQICGTKDVKNHQVDFILGQLYAEVDLNKNPCIFPNCGHFLTMESMDAQIGLEKYYNLSHDGTPITIKASAEPFRMEDIKNCALCRGHLRDLSRYGRLVRQAILDESTKKLILYINREFVPLAKDLANCIQRLQRFPYKQKVALPAVLRITGSRANQVQTMRTAVGNLSVARWGDMFRLREMIDIYGCRVSPDEQPSTRVSATVENARRRHQVSTAKSCGDGAIIQDKGVLLATALSTRLEIALLMDLMRMRGRTRVKILINLEDNRKECGSFINMARVSKRPALEAEGHVYLAQLHAIERWHCADASFSKEHLDNGRAALEKARSIVKVFPNQTRGLESEIDAAESMFLSTFYSAVSNAERLAVVQAMAREFVGTGHWYRCQNGHPFTIGECGGAMQESTCPECGSPVGGQRHQLVEGVTRAIDMEGGGGGGGGVRW